MSFNLENVPAVLHSCELHGKRAKRKNKGDADDKAPAREKKVWLSLDVTDERFAAMLDECWPGSKLLIRDMAGHDSAAQDLVSKRKMNDVRIRVRAVDNRTEVLAISVARSLGYPTLRIGKRAEKVEMSIRVAGPIASDNLRVIDDHVEADVFVDVGLVQTTIDDAIDAAIDETQAAVTAVTKTTRGKRGGNGVSVHVNGEQIGLHAPSVNV